MTQTFRTGEFYFEEQNLQVSKSSLSESGKLPKVSSGVSRNLTALERRISRFNSSAEADKRKPVSREKSPQKIVEKEEPTQTSTFKRKQLT